MAHALVAESENIEAAVRVLARSAADGDVRSAQALIPWLNRALGMPTERVEHRIPGSLEELEQMDTAELDALVAGAKETPGGRSLCLLLASTRNELTS